MIWENVVRISYYKISNEISTFRAIFDTYFILNEKNILVLSFVLYNINM